MFESVLDRLREVTLLVQDESEGRGEGMDIGVSYLTIMAMHARRGQGRALGGRERA